ncbi:LysR family transcriptional regulator [Devosia sp.]|uniref:LysR family transcriptional regulator n=1 Tax=Devosia sp. TaxID=1871048 RepID=UPI0025BFF204|nr:LysR family transcriptional regulator [Devosia sp.]
MRIRMDWRSVKFDWNRARAFLVTAEEGSLSAAARALGMTQPTLGRQVDALEEELGVVLFERAGRGLVLTPSGLELLDQVRRMGEAATGVSLTASGQTQSVEGSIRITASEIEALTLLPPIIAKLRREAPGINIEVLGSNVAADLRRREADIAIRSFRPTEPELIAKKIRESTARLFASSDYLDRLGRPVTLEKVNGADFIGYEPPDTFVHSLNEMVGLSVSRTNLKVISPSTAMHWELVKLGVGLSVIPDRLGDAERGVERVLDGVAKPLVFPTWLTTHRELNTSRRVRFVFDFLADELAVPAATSTPAKKPRR